MSNENTASTFSLPSALIEWIESPSYKEYLAPEYKEFESTKELIKVVSNFL